MQRVDVSFNQLRALPDAWSALTGLLELDARANQLTALPTDAMRAWGALTRLFLHRNELPELPDAFAPLTQLSHLDCRFGSGGERCFGRVPSGGTVSAHQLQLLCPVVCIMAS